MPLVYLIFNLLVFRLLTPRVAEMPPHVSPSHPAILMLDKEFSSVKVPETDVDNVLLAKLNCFCISIFLG